MSQQQEEPQPQEAIQPFRYMTSRCLFAQERDDTRIPREDWDGFLTLHADQYEREQTFLLPRNVLIRASDKFKGLVNHGDPQELDFRDENGIVFGAFVGWILEREMPSPPPDDLRRFDGNGDMAPAPMTPTTPATPTTPGSFLMPAPPLGLQPSVRQPSEPRNISQYMLLLIDLYMFADKWEVAQLKIAALDALAEALARWWVWPGPELRYIYMAARRENHLRRLAAVRALHSWDVFATWRQVTDDLDILFVLDVEELREQWGDARRGHEEWCKLDLCQFHDHRTVTANGDH